MCSLINYILDIKKLELRNTLDDVKVQYYIFKAKSMQLDDEVQKETKLQTNICRVIPVKLDSSNDNDALTDNALKSCLEELKNFYLEFDLHQSDGEYLVFFKFHKLIDYIFRKLFEILQSYFMAEVGSNFKQHPQH